MQIDTTEYVCACDCRFPDEGIAAEHVQWIHPEAYEAGNLKSFKDAIDRMIVKNRRRSVSNIVYKSENCYPDLLDLERVLDGLQAKNGKKKNYSSTELFQDFAVTFDWFHRVLPRLHFHGKHGFIPAMDVKGVVEEFAGRDLQEDAFVAACHERGLPTKKMGRGDYFADLEIKVPCLDRVMDVLPEWNAYVQEKQ